MPAVLVSPLTRRFPPVSWAAPAVRRSHPRRRYGSPALVLLAAAVLFSGCSPPPPAPEEAARAILSSEPFRVALTETLDSEASGHCPQALIARPDWVRWIGFGLASASEIMTAGGPICRLVLDETTRRDAESWSHRASLAGAPGGRIVVPVAVRSLLRVAEIRSTGRGLADAAFEWQWRPNHAGQRLGIDTAPRQGWAQLALDNEGWRAVRVEPGKG